ncbi:MAG: hypothetical protein VW625_02960, partial [Perlucidibaca sp.]
MQKSLSTRLAVLLIGMIWFMAQNAVALGTIAAVMTGHNVEAAQPHGDHIDLLLGHPQATGHAELGCDDCHGLHHIDIKPVEPATPDSKLKSQLELLSIIMNLLLMLLPAGRQALL